jgi:hypothetical protein
LSACGNDLTVPLNIHAMNYRSSKEMA